MLTTADFTKGTRYLHNDEPYVVVDVQVQSPTARGGSTLVKVKARNLLSGKLIADSFKSGTKFESPDLGFKTVQFLYPENDQVVFMDLESYEQFALPRDSLENEIKYLTEELKIRAMYFNGQPISLEIPALIPLQVTMVEPGVRGNTSSGSVTTRAELSNGMECQVPLHIKEGDFVLVDSATNSFHSRA